ncbi:MAG: roadblock/LC7 domain-containing protein [Promethearchaeota archaeon]
MKWICTRIHEKHDLLKKLLNSNPDVGAATIVSTEGLPIASIRPQGVDETKIAATTSALLSLSEKSFM